MASKIAEHGVLIEATVVQALDVTKRQPEVLHAGTILIGDDSATEYPIYRTASHYDAPPPDPLNACFMLELPRYVVGQNLGLIVLLPAKADRTGEPTRGKWRER